MGRFGAGCGGEVVRSRELEVGMGGGVVVSVKGPGAGRHPRESGGLVRDAFFCGLVVCALCLEMMSLCSSRS